MKSIQVLRREADIVFNESVAGKSVLDIGAWDGFFTFEAERRGATQVLANDHFCWSGKGWGTKAGFDYAHAKYASKALCADIDLFDLSPADLGTFDVVLFLGVLYHLKNPFEGLERAAAMSHNVLIVETVTTLNHVQEPVMRYYLGDELNGDGTNFWAPNHFCLHNMLRELGFKRFKTSPDPDWFAKQHSRVAVHAWRE